MITSRKTDQKLNGTSNYAANYAYC